VVYRGLQAASISAQIVEQKEHVGEKIASRVQKHKKARLSLSGEWGCL